MRARVSATIVGLALVLGLAAPAGAFAETAAPGVCQHVPTAESPLIHGRLTACGGSLVDARGHRVRLHSYEFTGMLPGNGDVSTPCLHWQAPATSLAGQLRLKGFNSVFMMLSWANMEPTRPTTRPNGTVVHHWNLGYLRALDAAIANFKAHGIAVVLGLAQWKWSPAFTHIDVGDGHIVPCGQGMPMWLYPHGGGVKQMAQAARSFFQTATKVRAGFLTAWKKISMRYAKQSDVVGFVLFWEAYELISEPFTNGHTLPPSALHLARWYQTIGRALHRFEPNQLLIAPDWQARGKNLYAVQSRPRLTNLAYAFEYYTYAWNDAARKRLTGYMNEARRWKAPAWIAEFNAFGHATSPFGTQPDPNWAKDTTSLLQQARSVRLSWTIFGTVDSRLANILRHWGT